MSQDSGRESGASRLTVVIRRCLEGVGRFGEPRLRRISLVTATLLLATTFVLPIWHTRMEAPQYRNEEALQVWVSASGVSGDLAEIETLNEYVGVRLPLSGVEVKLLPWAFTILVVTGLGASLLPASRQRVGAVFLLTLIAVVTTLGLGVLQYRLYEMGHVRGEQILEGVEDFTPPVLGRLHVANFDATMTLGAGGWALLVATLLCALTAFACFGDPLPLRSSIPDPDRSRKQGFFDEAREQE